jgi:hypothetical protein
MLRCVTSGQDKIVKIPGFFLGNGIIGGARKLRQQRRDGDIAEVTGSVFISVDMIGGNEGGQIFGCGGIIKIDIGEGFVFRPVERGCYVLVVLGFAFNCGRLNWHK